MQVKHGIAIAGLAFFVVGGVLLARSVRRGRELCRRLAEQFPEEYSALGSPLPGYFNSPRRNAYMAVIMQRKYETLSDPRLVGEFARLRRAEMWQLVYILAGFAGLGLAFVWLNWFHGA